MTSRFAIRHSLRVRGTKFAKVPGLMCVEWKIPARCSRGYQIDTDTLLLDRRRVAREIRREYGRIAGDIEQFNDRWLS